MRLVVLAVLGVAAANAYAFRPDLGGTWKFWVGLLVPHLLLAALALHQLWDDGVVLDVLKPKWGDLSLGAVTAMVLLFASWAARAALAPWGSPRHAWLLRIYLQLGDGEALQRSAALSSALLVIPLCEELIWRGFVQRRMEERFGPRKAWPLTAVLYALALTPTLVTLGDPVAGPNPLLVTAALGCGLVWGFTASLTRRLPPVIFSHLAFTYFTAVQFRWPGT